MSNVPKISSIKDRQERKNQIDRNRPRARTTRGRNLLKIRYQVTNGEERQCLYIYWSAAASFPVCLWQLDAASLHGALEGWPPCVH
jgi:hypothetical protein